MLPEQFLGRPTGNDVINISSKHTETAEFKANYTPWIVAQMGRAHSQPSTAVVITAIKHFHLR
jgi:hypothetical protein